jgi:release factor glutamine methyltransferase
MMVDGALQLALSLGVERLDAMVLLAHHLGRSREWLLAHGEQRLDETVHARFAEDCRRRADDTPLAYLTGTREFHGLSLQVDRSVLVPRPDTEILADWAIECLSALSATTPRPRVVDLGTGSGALALAIAHACPQAVVTATDSSEAALAVTDRNARQLGLSVRLRAGDWWSAVAGEHFDLAVANPPYVAPGDPHLHALRHEPQQALVAEDGGLATLRRIIAGARTHVAGWLLLEHGWDQADAVRSLLLQAGFTDLATRRDFNDQERCTGGRAA